MRFLARNAPGSGISVALGPAPSCLRPGGGEAPDKGRAGAGQRLWAPVYRVERACFGRGNGPCQWVSRELQMENSIAPEVPPLR